MIATGTDEFPGPLAHALNTARDTPRNANLPIISDLPTLRPILSASGGYIRGFNTPVV
jgi:hypothetical protein